MRGGRTLIDRILSLRESLGANQEEFAKRIGVSRNFISLVETGKRNLSDRTIADICREFNVNEIWLRTGEGEMFTQMSRTDEISAFVGSILKGEPDFRQKFISVLARMTPDEWQLLEKKVLELSEEIKKADP